MYQHDAATRVIARLNKEVTAAREALATLKPQAGLAPAAQPVSMVRIWLRQIFHAFSFVQAAVTDVTMAELPAEGASLSEDVVARLQDTATVLTQERKRRGRTAPEGLTSADAIRGFTTIASHPVSSF